MNDTINQLNSKSMEELKDIVDNPFLYEQNVVEKAKLVLMNKEYQKSLAKENPPLAKAVSPRKNNFAIIGVLVVVVVIALLTTLIIIGASIDAQFDFKEIVFDGVANNFVIAFFSCVIPITIGFLLALISKHLRLLAKPIHFLGCIFESISPIVLIIVLYYSIFGQMSISRMISCIIAFSISFIGYIPSKIKEEYSLIKNMIVNSVGLLAHAFKWSFCVRLVAVTELLNSTQRYFAMSQNTNILWVGFIISFVFVLVLNMIKFILEETIK